MIEKIWDYLRGLTVILSDIALCCLAFMLVPLVMHWDMAVAVQFWILTAAIQLLVGTALISYGVSWSAYLVVQTAAIAAGSIVTVRASWFPVYESDLGLALAACVTAAGMHNAYVAYRLPGSNAIMRFVDLLIVATAFYLYTAFQTKEAADQNILTVTLAALALNLLTVNHLRTGGEGGNVIRGAGAGSRLVLAGILAGCLFATGLIVGMASGQVHSAVDVLLLVLQGIYQVLSVIFGMIGRVLAFIILLLIALFPFSSQTVRENASVRIGQEMEEFLEETGTQVPAWVAGVIFAAILLILAGYVLYQLRGIRIQRIPRVSRRRRVVRKSHLLEALSGIMRQVWERLVFEWEYMRHRNSPQGLLVLAERVGKRNKLARRLNEPPGTYIRRFGGELGGYVVPTETSTAVFEQLAKLLDQIFYAERMDIPETFDCRLCARQIRLRFRPESCQGAWLFLRQYLTDAAISRKIEKRMSTESEDQYGNH